MVELTKWQKARGLLARTHGLLSSAYGIDPLMKQQLLDDLEAWNVDDTADPPPASADDARIAGIRDRLAKYRTEAARIDDLYGGIRTVPLDTQLLDDIDHLLTRLDAATKRTVALEAGLKFFSGAFIKWKTQLEAGDASTDFMSWAVNNGSFLDNADNAFGHAYDLLHANEKGDAG